MSATVIGFSGADAGVGAIASMFLHGPSPWTMSMVPALRATGGRRR